MYICMFKHWNMNRGKRTCEILKEVRRTVARENSIPLTEHECAFEGDCRGTCPYCEAEVRHLERELQRRISLGKAVTVAGIAVSSFVMGGCQSPTTSRTQGEMEQQPQITETQTSELSSSSEDSNGEESIIIGEDEYLEVGFVEEGEKNETRPSSGNRDSCKFNDNEHFVEEYVYEGIIEEIETPWAWEDEWIPPIDGTLAEYLRPRMKTSLDFLREPKFNNVYLVLIINDKGIVKEVLLQPKVELSTPNEKASYEEMTRILKSMPHWNGPQVAGSYEISIKELR